MIHCLVHKHLYLYSKANVDNERGSDIFFFSCDSAVRCNNLDMSTAALLLNARPGALCCIMCQGHFSVPGSLRTRESARRMPRSIAPKASETHLPVLAETLCFNGGRGETATSG